MSWIGALPRPPRGVFCEDEVHRVANFSNNECFMVDKMSWNNWSSVSGAVRIEIRTTARRMNHEALYMKVAAAANAARKRQEQVGIGIFAIAGSVAKEVVGCSQHCGVVGRGP